MRWEVRDPWLHAVLNVEHDGRDDCEDDISGEVSIKLRIVLLTFLVGKTFEEALAEAFGLGFWTGDDRWQLFMIADECYVLRLERCQYKQ